MTALTITFAAYWIPLLITIFWFVWVLFVSNQPSSGWFDLTALFVIMSAIIPLVAWLIYFIIN